MDEYTHPDPDSPYASSSPEAIERFRMIAARSAGSGMRTPEAFPTAAVGRLHGRFATVEVGSITLLCFEWEVEIQQEFADATAHGDYWFNPLPITERWTGRVRGYLANSAAASYGSSLFSKTNIGGAVAFTAYSDATAVTGPPAHPGTQVIFAGSAYGARSRLLVPDAMVTQEMELTGIGPPTTL